MDVFFLLPELSTWGMLSVKKSPAFPSSELETSLNQGQDLLCFCFKVKCLFIFMRRMFHNSSCNGVLADGTRPSCEMCGFFWKGRSHSGDMSTDVWSVARFMYYVPLTDVPTEAPGCLEARVRPALPTAGALRRLLSHEILTDPPP